MGKADQESAPGGALSSYTRIMTSTVRLLAYGAILLALFSAFHLIVGQFFADTEAVMGATIAMVATGAAAVAIAGGRIASLSDRWTAATESWMNACSI